MFGGIEYSWFCRGVLIPIFQGPGSRLVYAGFSAPHHEVLSNNYPSSLWPSYSNGYQETFWWYFQISLHDSQYSGSFWPPHPKTWALSCHLVWKHNAYLDYPPSWFLEWTSGADTSGFACLLFILCCFFWIRPASLLPSFDVSFFRYTTFRYSI